jgi:Carboxypeptidase regulatory-like domain
MEIPGLSARWRTSLCLGLLVAFLAFPSLIFSQFSSSIQGIVTDPTGAVVPNAKVQLRSLATEVVRSSTTGSDGIYHFVSLGPGRYEVKVTAVGFSAVAVTVDLITGQTLNVPIALKLATQTQAVVVTGQPPLLNTAETRSQETLGNVAISKLPLGERSLFPVMALTPGVVGLGTDLLSNLGTSTANFGPQMTFDLSANGRGPSGNMYVLDGLDVSSVVCNGCVNLEPNPDSIQEVSVQTNTFSTEYARGSGLQVLMNTKAGTTRYHGDVNDYFTYQGLWAGTEFVHNYAPFHTNNGSAAVGGPIWKKHNLFFFASTELLRSLTATGNQSITYESPQFVNLAKQNFPNTVGTNLLTSYPPSRATTAGVALTAASVFPSTCGTAATANIPCSLPMVDRGIFNASDYTNGTQYSFRIDKYFSKDRIYGSFYHTSLNTGGPVARPGLETTNPYGSQSIQVNETHTLSPDALNEAAFGFDRPWGNSAATGKFSVPGISVTGMNTGFSPTFIQGNYAQPNYHWRDVLSLIVGAHRLKFGYDGTRANEYDWRGPTYAHPNFVFTNLLNFVEDSPYSESQLSYSPLTGQSSPAVYFRTSFLHGAFVEDTWKATRRLTLTYGLRWDDFGNPFHHDMPGLPGNFYLGSGTTFDQQVANGSVIQTSHLLTHAMVAFSPRVGVAWDPTGTGKWVIRGGFGVYHDWLTLGASTDGVSTNPPAFLVPTFLTGTTTPPIFALGTSDTSPFGYPYPSLPATGLDDHGGLVGRQVNITATDPNVNASYIYIYTATLERALARNLVASVSYGGSRGTGLLTGSDNNGLQSFGNDINRFAGDLIVNNNVFTRLNPSFGTIKYSSNQSRSTYNAVTVALKGNWSNRGFLTAAYTRSSAWDNAETYPNFLLTNQYWGPSPHDAPNRFSLTGSYFVPSLGGNNAFVNRLTGGWELASNTIFQSGYPFTVYTSAHFAPIFNSAGQVVGERAGGGDYNADGVNFDFPNIPSTGYSQPHSRQAYLNGLFPVSAFTMPAMGTEGNELSNRFCGPNFADEDLALIKNNRITERLGLQFRFEFYNLSNRPNLFTSSTSGVVEDLSNGNFGRATTQHNPRYLQFALDLTW